MPLRYLKPIKWTSFFLPKSVFPLDFLLVSSTTITQLFKYPCFLPFFYLPHSWQDTVISTSRIQPDLCSPLLSSKFKSSYFVLTSATVSSLLPLLVILIEFPHSSQKSFLKYQLDDVTVFEIQIPCHGQRDLLDLDLPTSSGSSRRIPSPSFLLPYLAPCPQAFQTQSSLEIIHAS